MALTRNKPRTLTNASYLSLPLEAATRVWEGSCLGINSGSGKVRPLQSGDVFAGFARYKTDAAALETDVWIIGSGEITLPVTGLVASSVGAPVYATDDDTFTLTAGGSLVGTVLRVSGAQAVVAFMALRQPLTPAQLAAVQLVLNQADYSVVYLGTRGASLVDVVKFTGTADTASALGTLGLVVNEATDAAASTRLCAQSPDWSSLINGSATAGKVSFAGPYPSNILTVHMAVLGLAGPLTKQDSGNVDVVDSEMLKLTWSTGLNVRALLIVEGGPINFAGAAGTGSARNVAVYGLAVPV